MVMNWGSIVQFPKMPTLSLEFKIAYLGVLIYQEVSKSMFGQTIDGPHVDLPTL